MSFSILKMIFRLKYLRYKRSFTKKFDTLGLIIGTILGLFFFIQFLGIAYFSDIILGDIFKQSFPTTVIFQLTPLSLYLISIFRLIMGQGFDNGAVTLYQIKGDKTSASFLHLILNVVNIFNLFAFLIFLMVGIKNFYMQQMFSVFFLYFLEILSCLVLFELLCLSFQQYFINKNSMIFLLIIFFPAIPLFYFITKFGFPLPIDFLYVLFFLFLVCSLLIKLSYYTTKQFLTLDEYNTTKNGHKYLQVRQKNPITVIFSRYIFRNSNIRNQLIFFSVILVVFFLFIHFTDALFPGSVYYGLQYALLYMFLSEFMFSPDYKWIGYLHQGMIDIESYIKSKLNFLQIAFIVIIAIHLVLHIFFNFKWLESSIIVMIYLLGTLPYILSWIEIKGYHARDPYKNSIVDTNPNAGYRILIGPPIVMFPFLYLFIIHWTFGISFKTIQNHYLTYFSPLLFLGVLGLLLHNFWIKKLTEYYKKKRFEIFQKSESA